MVLWRPGLTLWSIVWNDDSGEARADRLERVKEDASPERFDERESHTADVSRWVYRLLDKNDDGGVESVYAFAFHEESQVRMAISFDESKDEAVALQLAQDVVPRPKA